MKRLQILGCSVCCVLIIPAVLQSQELIVNGSFETPATAPSYPNSTHFYPGMDTLTGWEPILSGVELSRGPAYDGVQYLDLNPDIMGGGGLKQTISTVVGETYSLSFSEGSSYSWGRNGAANILVSAGDLTQTFSVTTDSSGFYWERYSVPFTANSTSTVVSFRCLDAPGATFSFLDDVRITVPRPQPEFHAVLFGSLDDTINTRTAAERVKNALLEYPRISEQNINLVTDIGYLRPYILETLEPARPGDTVFIYLAGHGDYVSGDTSEPRVRNSALAVAKGAGLYNEADEYIRLEDGSSSENLTDDTLTGLLRYADKGVNLVVVIDSCMSGGFWGQSGNDADMGDLDKLATEGYSIAFLASASEGHLAVGDSTGTFFSRALALGLELGADDRTISFRKMGDWLLDLYNVETLGDTGHAYGSWMDGPVEVEISNDDLAFYSEVSPTFDVDTDLTPEPGTLFLVALGGLAVIRHRRK